MPITFPAEYREILDAVVANAKRSSSCADGRPDEDWAVGRRVANALAQLGYDMSPAAGMMAWEMWSLDQHAGFLMCDVSDLNDQPIINSFAALCENIQSGYGQLTMTDLLK